MTTVTPLPPMPQSQQPAQGLAQTPSPVVPVANTGKQVSFVKTIRRRVRIFGVYLLTALLVTPLTYRGMIKTFDMLSKHIHEREHITVNDVTLSPVAYITRIAEENTMNAFIITPRDYVVTIPETIGSVRSIDSFFINHTPITSLPDSIGELSALTYVLIQNTKLRSLPKTLGTNTALVDLSLQGNRLTNLPDVFGSLPNLEVLNLAYNEVSELPPSIKHLKKTVLLDLTGNKLRSVPRNLPPNLEVLYLGGNRIPLQELEEFQKRNALNDLIVYF